MQAGINAVEIAGGKFPFHCLKVLLQVIPLLSLKDKESERASPKDERSGRCNTSRLILLYTDTNLHNGYTVHAIFCLVTFD